jgi:hypothetical protein
VSISDDCFNSTEDSKTCEIGIILEKFDCELFPDGIDEFIVDVIFSSLVSGFIIDDFTCSCNIYI